ncbi:hypothetical protein Rhopal_005883-T1 [Rhodotorula paludigena]|uniref:F-box domain-containing protein n=1 Tax=Rhodotorula paludigena TaxID=86838 RepID=A0AAV5GSF9_9BASI|nr:hypothetical protein Rhopal_005883-T1 [Rhodotorula paludigena]
MLPLLQLPPELLVGILSDLDYFDLASSFDAALFRYTPSLPLHADQAVTLHPLLDELGGMDGATAAQFTGNSGQTYDLSLYPVSFSFATSPSCSTLDIDLRTGAPLVVSALPGSGGITLRQVLSAIRDFWYQRPPKRVADGVRQYYALPKSFPVTMRDTLGSYAHWTGWRRPIVGEGGVVYLGAEDYEA